MQVISVLILLLFSLEAFAQNNVVTRQTESIRNLRSGEEFPFDCTFEIHSNVRVDWIQENYTQGFAISSVDGVLPDSGEGSITYRLEKEGKKGFLAVERVDSAIWLTIDLRDDSKSGAYYRFKVFNP